MSKKKEDLNRVKPKHPNKKLRLTVDIPVSVNHMYYNTKYGGKRLNSKAEKYFNKTKARIADYIYQNDYKMEDSNVWQYLDIVVYMPDKRRRDSHNMLKLLMDTIEGLAYRDDYTVMTRIQSVELDRDNPRLEMVLSNQTKTQRTKCIKEICYE